MIRAFFAVDVDPLGRALEIAERARSVDAPRGLRWMSREQLHVTMKFLGQIEEAQVEPLAEIVRAVARTTVDCALRVAELTAFPKPSRARVVVLELAGDGIASLAARIEALCEPLGFASEQRPFRAHLTLARARDAIDMRRWLGRTGPVSGALTMTRLSLFRSDQGPEGSRYTALAEAPLRANRQCTGGAEESGDGTR